MECPSCGDYEHVGVEVWETVSTVSCINCGWVNPTLFDTADEAFAWIEQES